MKKLGAHDSLIRAGDKLARYLEARYDGMKRMGPGGFRESYGMLRALNQWRSLTARLRGKAQP